MTPTWSTRQLADLAGVTLRSIRHWHDVGLLPEPERLENGYKQYTVRHLVLALRIARLAGLGFTLEQIARILDSEEHGQASLRGLRAELDRRIAELRRIRREVDELIALGVSPDLSPDALLAMEALGDDPASRNLAIVLTHLMSEEDTATLLRTLRGAPAAFSHVNAALLTLPADAAEEDVAALADEAVATIEAFFADAPDELRADAGLSREQQLSADVVDAVATEGMNDAQRRVMRLVVERLEVRRTPG